MSGAIRIVLAVSTLAVLGLCATAGAGVKGAPLAQKAPQVRLAEASLIVEVNATDGDAGLQPSFDGDPWRAMTIFSPDGRKLMEIGAVGRLHNFGLTELFSESSEPPFTEFPLAEFRKLFPEGRYTFAGETVEGQSLTGAARLSHDIPAGPEITSPEDGATVGRSSVIARWNAVAEPGGIDIVGYRVIVTRENPLRVFNADLPAAARSMPVPAEFLQSGVEYKVEVQAIEESGNQTLTEISFTTR